LPTALDPWFQSIFGMDRAAFQRQPATVQVTCGAAGCTMADLASRLDGYPRNPIWVNGSLTIDTATDLGNATDPVMLIVTGTLTLSNNATMVGFIHANAINWTAAASTATLLGAMMSPGAFTATGTATIAYSKPVLDLISLRYGSFVKLPGGWNLTDRVVSP
jgi:hypothetical protein